MLNPFAHEYTPASAFPPESSTKNTPFKKKDQQHSKKKKANNNKAETLTKKTESKSKKSSKESTHSKARRKSSHTQAATAVPLDLFEKESKFITIEAAVDPIRRIDLNNSKSSTIHNQNTSTLTDKHLFEHGYERYIDWIDRSLRVYDTVTLIGMDNAIIDIVSLVTILHDRKLGVHDDVETFSMDTEINNRITACIQVKLHPYY